ncbi:hypothetical protein WJX72_001396 [[Myrmecia] bisecta]|uniref:Uncharacterized protein n=1 Tax=[Myrmecia] bisecta TaxID=41462 RepID=A0AAW1PEG4_9CHLO
MSSRTEIQIPSDLAGVPRRVLESYVRDRLLQVVSSVGLSRRLGVPTDTLRQAFSESLAELSGPEPQHRPGGPELQLVFRHDCLNQGCLDSECPLCAQNPLRRCEGNFAQKYLAGDILKAKCGAAIRVEVIDRNTMEPVSGEVLGKVYLEMCILDGKAYASLQDAGRENYEEDIEGCVLLTNNQGKELLVPGRQGQHNDHKRVVLSLTRGQAHLPDLTVTGSSEALLSGTKPPFRLLVRALNQADHTRATRIRFAVSEAFVVATPRVRTAVKADIPHIDDHVSKLQAVGIQTQNKLQDIRAAAAAVGIYDIQVPHNTVTKVGQFKELVIMAEQDRPLCEALKRVLKLTRGWELARDHALMAVDTDNQMRIWYSDTSMEGGLMFRCSLGSVDLENPVGLLQKKESDEHLGTMTMEATLIPNLDQYQKELVRRLQRQALVCWWQNGHPGWQVAPYDTDEFLRSAPGGIAGGGSQDNIGAAPAASHPTSSGGGSVASFGQDFHVGSFGSEAKSQPFGSGQFGTDRGGQFGGQQAGSSGPDASWPGFAPVSNGNMQPFSLPAEAADSGLKRSTPPPSPFGNPDQQNAMPATLMPPPPPQQPRGDGTTPADAMPGIPAPGDAQAGSKAGRRLPAESTAGHKRGLSDPQLSALSSLLGRPINNEELVRLFPQLSGLDGANSGGANFLEGLPSLPLNNSSPLNDADMANMLALQQHIGSLGDDAMRDLLSPMGSGLRAFPGLGQGRVGDGGAGHGGQPAVSAASILYGSTHDSMLPSRELRRSGSSGIMKIDSIEDLSTAMLHDPELSQQNSAAFKDFLGRLSQQLPVAQLDTSGAGGAPAQGAAGGSGAPHADPAASCAPQSPPNLFHQHASYGRVLRRGTSALGASNKSDGLQSMQSIEDALQQDQDLANF